MLPTNFDHARVRMEDRMRTADKHRLVKQARAERRAARPQRSGVLAAVRRVSAAAVRSAPWKREAAPQAGRVSASAMLSKGHPS